MRHKFWQVDFSLQKLCEVSMIKPSPLLQSFYFSVNLSVIFATASGSPCPSFLLGASIICLKSNTAMMFFLILLKYVKISVSSFVNTCQCYVFKNIVTLYVCHETEKVQFFCLFKSPKILLHTSVKTLLRLYRFFFN